jgi:hypothetical protein
MKEKLEKIRKTFDNFYWGADLKLLKMCSDSLVRFVKYELLIILIAGLVMFVTNNVARGYGYFVGIIVFFIYKWFLSNLNLTIRGESYGFLKFLIGIIIALGIAYAFCTKVLNISLGNMNIVNIISVSVVLIITIVICFVPIRFEASRDSLYKNLLNLERQQEQKQAEIRISTKVDLKIQEEKAKAEIQKKAQKEYLEALTHEIANTRLRVAKVALEKWENEQKKRVETNIEEYIQNPTLL